MDEGLLTSAVPLEAVTRALACHAAPRDSVQFPVDERNQSLEGTLVAPPPFEKEPGDSRGVRRNGPILGLFARSEVFAAGFRF